MSIIQILIAITLIEVIIALFLFYKEIISFIFPDNYVKIIMIHFDLSIKEWIQKKSKDFAFKYGDINYKLYNKENPLENRGFFKKGRLTTFLYFQNNEFPIKPSNVELKPFDTNYKEMLKTEISGLWVEKPNALDFLQKNLLPILLALGLIIIIILIITKPAPTSIIQGG